MRFGGKCAPCLERVCKVVVGVQRWVCEMCGIQLLFFWFCRLWGWGLLHLALILARSSPAQPNSFLPRLGGGGLLVQTASLFLLGPTQIFLVLWPNVLMQSAKIFEEVAKMVRNCVLKVFRVARSCQKLAFATLKPFLIFPFFW